MYVSLFVLYLSVMKTYLLLRLSSFVNYEEMALRPMVPEDREQFIAMNQESFQIAVDEYFGPDAGTAIPRSDIEESLDAPDAHAFIIQLNGEDVGGVCVQVQEGSDRGSLDLLFVKPGMIGKGIGMYAWKKVESMYPSIHLWETHTPYFDVRNIHFYVNKCGFSIVEFYCPRHPMEKSSEDFPGSDLFFRFEKHI